MSRPQVIIEFVREDCVCRQADESRTAVARLLCEWASSAHSLPYAGHFYFRGR